MLSGELSAYPDGFQPGSVLAGYRLEALVGVGGMAVVWQARSLRLDRPVALKILASALATDAGFRLRFIAEARAAALVDDPHIIPIYDADEADGVLFIAMRFVGGGDLRRLVEREGALSPARAVEFISPVASALDAAHAAGLVHRDVKPANILVDARAGRPDHVYLSDFGISKAAMSSMNLTAMGQALGTPEYMAPEQIEGHAVDGRTDQYALACVTYRLLTERGAVRAGERGVGHGGAPVRRAPVAAGAAAGSARRRRPGPGQGDGQESGGPVRILRRLCRSAAPSARPRTIHRAPPQRRARSPAAVCQRTRRPASPRHLHPPRRSAPPRHLTAVLNADRAPARQSRPPRSSRDSIGRPPRPPRLTRPPSPTAPAPSRQVPRPLRPPSRPRSSRTP